MSARSSRKRRKLKADINVVPYIDVMLVLLIIFMVTAPLLNLGVDVNLPKANAKPLQQKKESLIAIIDGKGNYSLQIKSGKDSDTKPATSVADLAAQVQSFHAQNPTAPVFVAADGKLDYQRVVDLMSSLQQAGVEKVSLMMSQAEPATTPAPRR